MRRTVLLLLLAALVAPATAAQACDVILVESLETELSPAPAAFPAGRVLPLALTVTRAGVPAAGIDVFARLDGATWAAYKGGVTGEDGTARLPLAVPRDAHGAAELDVQAYREVLDLPCAGVEEYDRVGSPWGRVR